MGMISAGEPKAWITNLDRHTLGLKVVLLKEVFVLPRNQFLYAQGGDDEVRAVFTTHDVVAKGCGLASLLSDLAAQQVTRLKEPARAERFAHATGARITELYVRKAEQTDDSGS
ncbi:MAG: hypothetical protein DMG57_29065 [Acidobacteria bacterium]|nr:MAG: hypothetical protein DMG57_29065 [Acidobacteriota bacterium]